MIHALFLRTSWMIDIKSVFETSPSLFTSKPSSRISIYFLVSSGKFISFISFLSFYYERYSSSNTASRLSLNRMSNTFSWSNRLYSLEADISFL